MHVIVFSGKYYNISMKLLLMVTSWDGFLQGNTSSSRHKQSLVWGQPQTFISISNDQVQMNIPCQTSPASLSVPGIPKEESKGNCCSP